MATCNTSFVQIVLINETEERFLSDFIAKTFLNPAMVPTWEKSTVSFIQIIVVNVKEKDIRDTKIVNCFQILPWYLIEVNSFIQAFLPEGCQVNEAFPLLVDLINAPLDFLCAEITSRNEIIAHL